jgi:hypothetical protein
MRPEPRWTIAFLRALEQTREVRGAAEDAGVDYSTAHARRRRHAGFAAAWESALRRHSGRTAEAEKEAVGAIARDPSTIVSPGNGSPPRAELREELSASSNQVKRVGARRWSQAREAVFFEELAATANVKRAARAAGYRPMRSMCGG